MLHCIHWSCIWCKSSAKPHMTLWYFMALWLHDCGLYGSTETKASPVASVCLSSCVICSVCSTNFPVLQACRDQRGELCPTLCLPYGPRYHATEFRPDRSNNPADCRSGEKLLGAIHVRKNAPHLTPRLKL